MVGQCKEWFAPNDHWPPKRQTHHPKSPLLKGMCSSTAWGRVNSHCLDCPFVLIIVRIHWQFQNYRSKTKDFKKRKYWRERFLIPT